MNADFSLLLKTEYLMLLARCFDAPHSISMLAEVCHAKPNTVFRRVQKLVQAGVLKESHQEKRAGKAIKFFVPAQETFDIPFALTPYASLAEYMAERLGKGLHWNVLKAYRKLDLPDENVTLRVFHLGGVLQVDLALHGEGTAQTYQQVFVTAHTLHRWVPLHLSDAELRELHQELEDLTRRYFRPFQEGDQQTAALGLFLLPN